MTSRSSFRLRFQSLLAPRGLPVLTLALVLGAGLAPSACARPASATSADRSGALLDPNGPAMRATAPDTFKVLFETTTGDFVIEAYREWAPVGVDRFYNLARNGYFDDVRFFRVVPRFVVQFGLHGDTAVSRVWSSAVIPDDSVRTSNRRGTVTFAKSGPNTRNVQLFVNVVDNSRLDATGFSPIGRITGGMDVVERFYSGYGEMAPSGRGPNQARIRAEGDAYMAAEFPMLDRILRSRILPR